MSNDIQNYDELNKVLQRKLTKKIRFKHVNVLQRTIFLVYKELQNHVLTFKSYSQNFAAQNFQ